MDTRATRTRLSVLPVFIALLFNVMAPVLAMAVPQAVPSALAPKVAVAADAPVQVTFTLEGCRLEDGDFIEATLTCTEPGYTPGNLGKEWAELDRVPHRLTASNGNGAQTYDINISADYLRTGTIGYDIISVPTLKSGPCTFVVSDQFVAGGQAGGADSTISRTLTITQPAGSTCVFDYNMRLALGSSGYSGSSLHAYLLAEGVGEKRVPLPVDKDFPPQELRKDMTATQGQAYTWSVSKSSDPLSLNFLNTCATTEGARSANVNVTVSWTRSGPTATGNTVVTTNIYAKNPSERTILVAVSDSIYTGTDQSSPAIDTASAAATAVPANTELLLLTHSFEYAGAATQFNDVATATYTDPINPDVTIPGNTTATASATAVPAGGTPANASAVITDTESITGTGLSFSVAGPLSSGSFTNGYVAGASVTPGSTVEWSSGTVSGNGSITFAKTVSVDQARITSGTLTDTATVTSTDGQTTLATSDPLNIGITADAQVSLTINKTIPDGALRTGESVTFDFKVYAGATATGTPVATPSITFNAGGDIVKSVDVTGLDPGQYTVHEVPEAGWATISDKQDTITLPDCAGSVTFNNTELPPALTPLKTADDAIVTAGQEIGFVISVGNSAAAGTGTAEDVEILDNLPGGPGIDWEIADDSLNGDDCSITGELGSEVLDCAFLDLAPGASASVHVVSDTTAASCRTYSNTATISASNVDPDLTASASTTVECPGLNILKRQVDAQGVPTSGPILAGETAYFEIVVWNSDDEGIGTATNVVVTENEEDLPDGVDWQIDAPEGVSCASSLSIDAGQAFSCELGDLEPGETVSILVSGVTDREDCGALVNTARVDADNNDDEVPPATATILVSCPEIELEKVNDAVGSVLPGTTVKYTLTLTVSDEGLEDGIATDVMVFDKMPIGLENPTLITPDGTFDSGTRTITWSLGDLAEGTYELSYSAVVSNNVANGAVLVNAAEATSPNTPCPDRETNGPECEAESPVTVRVPTLVIDKAASIEVITISGPATAPVATPSVVTWTLTYTLTNGPVTGAVITDPIPVGFTFLDASDGGTFANGLITWNLGTLNVSSLTDSVTFRTTVNPATISRTAPTVNTATIDSNETLPDTGQDSVTVTVQPPVLGGNPPLPNTATGFGLNGEPVQVPIELLVAFFIGSLGALALANVKASNRRR